MKELCFLDMDGVIADFVSGICRAHQRKSPYKQATSFGVFDMEKLWEITPREFWDPIRGNEDFWTNLEKTPDADDIVALVSLRFGVDNVAILTAPSSDPFSVSGKRKWIKRYYPEFEKQMIFSSAKKFMAGPGRYLIDDRDKNILDFRDFGGVGVTVPRPWNNLHGVSDESFYWLEKWLVKGLVNTTEND